MEVMYWNIRGVANINSQLAHRNFCAENKPDVLFVSEPIAEINCLPVRFWRLCGLKFFVASENEGSSSPKLWVCCKEGLQIQMVASTNQHLTVEITSDAKVCRVSGIYASTGHIG